MVPARDRAVLDASVLADIRALGMPGEANPLAEVTELFLSSFPRDLSALRTAIAAKDVESVYTVAHRMRGSALGVGAIRLIPICAAIENAARVGCLEQAVAEAAGLDQEVDFACLALEQASR
jgi:HPt (histidine-containing phosphotransfer) domain-containing protein